VTDGQDKKESEGRRKGAVYQGGSEAVFAILIAAGIGYWLDSRFDTAPTLLLIGLAVGFASFTLRLIRLGRNVQRRAQNEAEETRESGNESEQ
jgi:F0F1-type ATP synthase assembly protein I